MGGMLMGLMGLMGWLVLMGLIGLGVEVEVRVGKGEEGEHQELAMGARG